MAWKVRAAGIIGTLQQGALVEAVEKFLVLGREARPSPAANQGYGRVEVILNLTQTLPSPVSVQEWGGGERGEIRSQLHALFQTRG